MWQNGSVARGWESKAVEEQVESAEQKKPETAPKGQTPEQSSRQRELEGLRLSRTRIVRELEAATHPRHREQLTAALKFLDDKIAELS
ncbi:MAG: hypothetical protein AUG07_06910 [Acidobacteria bacterium 13_1_20CM_2_60_10]|nr:MAG: hypothetical protein AUG07_06910 [Acidobacteria bacterium 13_1_20CM_2_60_10]PYU08806.1 MAG: hypothetical protein DMG33_00460 [Acidobacteriota bacterium]